MRQTLDSPRTNGRLGLLGLCFPICEMGPQQLPWAGVLRGRAVNGSPEAVGLPGGTCELSLELAAVKLGWGGGPLRMGEVSVATSGLDAALGGGVGQTCPLS